MTKTRSVVLTVSLLAAAAAVPLHAQSRDPAAADSATSASSPGDDPRGKPLDTPRRTSDTDKSTGPIVQDRVGSPGTPEYNAHPDSTGAPGTPGAPANESSPGGGYGNPGATTTKPNGNSSSTERQHEKPGAGTSSGSMDSTGSSSSGAATSSPSTTPR